MTYREDRRPDYTCESRNEDETGRRDHCRHSDRCAGEDDEQEQQRRDTEHDVDGAHDQRVDATLQVPGEHPEGEAGQVRHTGRRERKADHGHAAVQHPAEDIASELIGAEQAGRTEWDADNVVGAMRRNQWADEGDQNDQRAEPDPDAQGPFRLAIVTPTTPPAQDVPRDRSGGHWA